MNEAPTIIYLSRILYDHNTAALTHTSDAWVSKYGTYCMCHMHGKKTEVWTSGEEIKEINYANKNRTQWMHIYTNHPYIRL